MIPIIFAVAILLFNAPILPSDQLVSSEQSKSSAQPVVTYDQTGELLEVITSSSPAPTSSTILFPDSPQRRPSSLQSKHENTLQALKTKRKQIYASAGATSILGILTLYYACTTNSDTWFSSAAGSFGTNFLLTSMAMVFLCQDKKHMEKALLEE